MIKNSLSSTRAALIHSFWFLIFSSVQSSTLPVRNCESTCRGLLRVADEDRFFPARPEFVSRERKLLFLLSFLKQSFENPTVLV